MIEIVQPGPLCTVQDLGRPGHLALGVSRSGAFDRSALRLANRLVGNPEDHAALEITFGGLVLRALDAVTVALTGAPCPGPLGWGSTITLRAGQEITLGTPAVGLRSYLAVRGGIDVELVLGSRSTDTLSGVGPPVVRAGGRLAVGLATGAVPGVDAVPGRSTAAVLSVLLGPRDDWFTAAACAALTSAAWLVRGDCDRVGIRLDGPALERRRGGELPSEATLPGALQVPPDGRPILFGADAPVTGGYPVIGVVTDLDRAAQLRPGDRLRFRLRSSPPR